MRTRSPDEIPVKLFCSEDRLTVAAPLPGLEPQDITVRVERPRFLVIEGRQRGSLKGAKDEVHDEWNSGPYERRLELPVDVDGGLANLTFENGVLVISLPMCDTLVQATLKLERIGRTLGRRIGNAGRPVHATSLDEHYSLKEHERHRHD